jgi:uncharacterized membrane protein YphA (DoxX/SURF4 family)
VLDTESVGGRLRGPTIGGVRITAGLLWLANVHWKVPTDFGESSGGGLYKYIASGAERAPLAPFRWALREIVLANFQLFGWFTLVVETVLASLLLIGYRTRLVALIGAAQAIPIGLTVIYYEGSDEWSWSYLMMIGLHLVLWAVAAGDHVGVDGVLAAPRDRSRRALGAIGVVGANVGVLGLFVGRSVGFAGRKAALLGSDAGFAADGTVVRRWELKFLWFNPLWALLTIAFGLLLVAGTRYLIAAWAGAVGFVAIAVIVFSTQWFEYVRDDGAIQRVSTASNSAFWAGLALAGALFARRVSSSVPSPATE